jgi:hypothetical protein
MASGQPVTLSKHDSLCAEPTSHQLRVARHLNNRGLDLVNLREQRFLHGHLVCATPRSAVADAPITRVPRG